MNEEVWIGKRRGKEILRCPSYLVQLLSMARISHHTCPLSHTSPAHPNRYLGSLSFRRFLVNHVLLGQYLSSSCLNLCVNQEGKERRRNIDSRTCRSSTICISYIPVSPTGRTLPSSGNQNKQWGPVSAQSVDATYEPSISLVKIIHVLLREV